MEINFETLLPLDGLDNPRIHLYLTSQHGHKPDAVLNLYEIRMIHADLEKILTLYGPEYWGKSEDRANSAYGKELSRKRQDWLVKNHNADKLQAHAVFRYTGERQCPICGDRT